jgi:HlyD family secretion protein
MKRKILSLMAILFFVSAVAIACVFFPASNSVSAGNKYIAPVVQRGEIEWVVNSTGKVEPVQSVQVGACISGPVEKVLVNFNDKVAAGQLLAQVDPRLFKAAVAREEAALARCKAELSRIKALWIQAVRKEERAKKLQVDKAISETDMDLCTAERATLDAQLQITESLIHESEANLTTAQANLEFTNIKSPVDGIVIDRKIDPGQTVASMFLAPALFVIAPDLEKKVDVYASVKEDDIIHIREAKERNEPVSFTVNAYPNVVFGGKIEQIRLNPTIAQNGANYTVVVEAPNANFRLLPGMTANISFQIEKHTNVPIIPTSALDFFPKPEQVRLCDRPILKSLESGNVLDQLALEGGQAVSCSAGAATFRCRNRKYVWVPSGDLLSAVPIEIGLCTATSVEVVSSRLAPGQEVVVGCKGQEQN